MDWILTKLDIKVKELNLVNLERLTATSALQEHKTLLNNLNNELKITNESLRESSDR